MYISCINFEYRKLMIYIADDDYWLIKLICWFFSHFKVILQIPKTKTCVDSKYSRCLYRSNLQQNKSSNQSLIKASWATTYFLLVYVKDKGNWFLSSYRELSLFCSIFFLYQYRETTLSCTYYSATVSSDFCNI